MRYDTIRYDTIRHDTTRYSASFQVNLARRVEDRYIFVTDFNISRIHNLQQFHNRPSDDLAPAIRTRFPPTLEMYQEDLRGLFETLRLDLADILVPVANTTGLRRRWSPLVAPVSPIPRSHIYSFTQGVSCWLLRSTIGSTMPTAGCLRAPRGASATALDCPPPAPAADGASASAFVVVVFAPSLLFADSIVDFSEVGPIEWKERGHASDRGLESSLASVFPERHSNRLECIWLSCVRLSCVRLSCVQLSCIDCVVLSYGELEPSDGSSVESSRG